MLIIANPVSRRGRGAKYAELVAAELDSRGLPHRLCLTDNPLHATKIAKQAAEAGEKLVLCVGGDGTLSEVAGGLCGSETALGIIPAGTGDDFARYLGLPQDPLKALDIALCGGERVIDLGLANGRVFINIAGSGIDVSVLRHTLFYKRFLHGLPAYVLGVLRAVTTFAPAETEIIANGETVRRKCMLVNVANGRFFGGGMMVAPEADASDGLFDVHYVDELTRMKVLSLLAGFIKGTYVRHSFVHSFRCEELTVRYGDSSLQMDGEITTGNPVTYKLLKSALRVRVER
jgi:YegS/Rv2252/BmrU family lipid kinase